MNDLIDWLGKDFRIRKTNADGQMEVTLICNETSMFYWALQYGLSVEIVEPISLRKRISEAVAEMDKSTMISTAFHKMNSRRHRLCAPAHPLPIPLSSGIQDAAA